MIATTKLLCPECRRENEPERIYCHECGARLDRSALAKAKSKEEDPKETQRRLQSMLDPRRALLRQRFFQGSKLVLAALIMAALVQMLRPPEMPTAPQISDLPVQINLDLENAAMDPRVAPPGYTQDQVNAYLAYVVKGKQTVLSNYLKFERAAVAFTEGTFRVTVERSLFGYSIFTTGTYSARLQNGDVILKNLGGQIGRLPVHPMLMQFGDIVFADLRGVLERERKSIVKLGGAELHPQAIVFLARTPQT